MTVVYSQESLTTIFLAGPTPRDQEVKSWRPEMIEYLSSNIPNLVFFSPEPKNGIWQIEYDNQTEWEYEHIEKCDILLFWIPRDINDGMPGFTTNVEFGYWLEKKENLIVGWPPRTEKVKYLAWLLKKIRGIEPVHTKEEILEKIVEITRKTVR